MSIRWEIACHQCCVRSFVNKAGQIYDAVGANIWIDYPPNPLDIAEIVLFIKAHNGHPIGLYPDNDDPILGDMLEWKQDTHVPSELYRKYSAREKRGTGER